MNRSTFAEAYAQAANTRDLCRKLGGLHHETVERMAEEYGFDISQEYWKGITVDVDDEQAVKHLQSKGYTVIRERAPEYGFRRATTSTFEGHSFRLGVVSDTHLCSCQQQLSHLHTAYDVFEREGIDTVLHAGDVTTGNGKVYKGQLHDVFLLGADAQKRYAVDNFPRREGIVTHTIGGNHDESWFKDSGYDIVNGIAEQRSDIIYHGYACATLDFYGIKVMLWHPRGAPSAYARSYKLQRVIESISPKDKPHILLMGHYHSTCTVKCYRNVYGLMLGCFESQTKFEVEKGLYPEIGFSILDIGWDEDGVVNIKEDWHPFYVPVERDY